MKKKKVVLTFDYELFFGDKSGTVYNTLIYPTNMLMDAMEKVGFRGNFFIDYLMLIKLREQRDLYCKRDLIAIESQIYDMIRRGHRIELHIHPHWRDARYNGNGTWNFDNFTHYSLNSFSKDDIKKMFVEGANLLNSLARQIDPGYCVVAFRAGGWAIQPFELLEEGFRSSGIFLDSSVMTGVEIITDYSYCNFLSVVQPSDGYYRFTNNVDIQDKNGRYVEVPISSIKRNFLSRLVGRIANIYGVNYKTLADGTHFRKSNSPDKWNSSTGKSVCTFSTVSPLDSLIRLLFSPDSILCYIDHPKDLSKSTIPSIKAVSLFSKSLFLSDFINI